MCLDSLYGAYLKVHYPYEFYATMLKLYTEKGNKDKIALIIDEMRRYQSIRLQPGRFGQDNRGWFIDKENHAISQALSSIKFIPKSAAEDLYRVGQNTYETFTDLLRTLQMDTCLSTRHIEVLISIGYFAQFGGNGKLMQVFQNFYEGKTKLTKTLCQKTVDARMQMNREAEAALEDSLLPIETRLRCENDYVGLCLSSDDKAHSGLFFVSEVDDKYGVKAKLYSVRRGTSGAVKVSKATYAPNPFKVGDCITIQQGGNRPRYSFKDGKKTKIPGEQDYWIAQYTIAPSA